MVADQIYTATFVGAIAKA